MGTNLLPALRLAARVLLGWIAVGAAALAQERRPGQPTHGPPALPQGVTREQMWPAPTAEDWKKPCLVAWERSWDDALAVARETGKLILVCVNMDGEIASEHYAGVRYRQPEIAQLYEPYVCVIASVYRHNPRDFDDAGERIPCPRFGSVTCGEHIDIEPLLFEKFMDGQRVAPRHIAVEPDAAGAAKEKYDVYFTWDTDTVFGLVREGPAGRPEAKTIVRGDRPIVERVASRAQEDRRAVERAYRDGDRAVRQALLDAAGAHPEAAPSDLLRLALHGLDPELSEKARRALAGASSPESVNLIGEALRAPLEPADHEALVAALERLGDASPRARTLAVVYHGLDGGGATLDLGSWAAALEKAKASAPPDPQRFRSVLARQSELLAAPDPSARAELAAAFAAAAQESDEADARLAWIDARENALAAEKAGAKGWNVDATLALAAIALGDAETAGARTEAAMRSIPPWPLDGSVVTLLERFGRARGRAIGEALRAKRSWPPSWFTDMHGAFGLLLRHPLGTDAHAASHYDVLRWVGASGESQRFLQEGLARFPTSTLLHDRLRLRWLEEKGPAGMEKAYAELAAAKDAAPGLPSFAGYAALVAAEFHRRAAAPEAALAAYERAIALYERALAASPASRDECDHFVAIAHAGRARVASEQGRLADAVAELLAAFERKPEASATPDGLGLWAVATARVVITQLQEKKDAPSAALAAQLTAALERLGKIDPALLELPAYERIGASGR
jgi:tetratricopeptide (TPR) repeat protein